MKILLATIITLCTCYHSNAQAKKYSVKIKATTTSNYCGGAAPSDDMVEKLKTPRGINGTTFYIISGSANKANRKIIDSFITDDLGEANIKLRAGTFAIITSEQKASFKNKTNDDYQTWDNACLLKRWQTPQVIFKSAAKKNISFNIEKPCQWSMPCGKYTGPLPS
jgi:hypothetical protein